jgi:phosphoserine/homoserine phosphotransferase
LSTLAVGDAFNDLSMLRQASQGFLFRPSLQTRLAAQDLVVAASYQEILDALDLRSQTGLANMANRATGAILA